VAAGQATISQQGALTTIKQNSGAAIINWQQFATSAGETIEFLQPSSQSAVLNRVTGSGASVLNGQLLANGDVFLINPCGVLIGPSGSVDVASFLATSSSISDADFMAGRYNFGSAPDGSSIINQGKIVADGGAIVLSAPQINNSGVIQARLGSISLGAARTFSVDVGGDGLLFYQIGAGAAQAMIANSGSLAASGGSVHLSARSIDIANREVINTTGLIEANSVSVKDGEVIIDGGSQGIVSIGGSVQAAGASPGQTGGSVAIAGNRVILAKASIDASGSAGGGTISIGSWQAASTSVDAASLLNASAALNGQGGSISVIGGQTQVAGTLLARGGSAGGDGGTIETSGHDLAVQGASVDAGTTLGKAGTWLLDPYDLTVNYAASLTLENSLATTNVTLQTTSSGTSGPGTANASGHGDIVIDAPLSWSGNTTLTMSAYRNIDINAEISMSGSSSGLVMKTGQGTTGNDITGEGASITLPSTANVQICSGSGCTPATYTLISNLSSISCTSSSCGGDYAFDNHVTVGITAPIGYVSSGNNASPYAFTGIIDGFGHSISGFNYTNTAAYNLGLISETTGATLKNFGIYNSTLTGPSTTVYYTAGLLVGQANSSTINNVWSDGTVSAGSVNQVGGLIGAMGNGTTLSNSFAVTTVSGGTAVGGLVGANYGVISNSYATGSVAAGTSGLVGGLVGFNASGAGGIGTIIQSYASGNVSGGSSAEVGGLIGENAASATISTTYAVGSVAAGSGSTLGGLIGKNDSGGSISSSYWDTTTSGTTVGIGSGTATGASGLSDSNMKLQASFSGWDFTNSWAFQTAGNAYPILSGFSYQLYVYVNPSTGSMTYGGTVPTISSYNRHRASRPWQVRPHPSAPMDLPAPQALSAPADMPTRSIIPTTSSSMRFS
jgi:filamentous hemagglutinin family protein